MYIYMHIPLPTYPQENMGENPYNCLVAKQTSSRKQVLYLF